MTSIDAKRTHVAAVPAALAATAAWVAAGAITSRGASGYGARYAIEHAAQRTFDVARIDGVTLGFYGDDASARVITLPSERFRIRFAATDLARSGHIDAYVAPGAMLPLPAFRP